MKRITIPEGVDPVTVFGPSDQVLRAIERGFPGIEISGRGDKLAVSGDAHTVDIAAGLLEELMAVAQTGTRLTVGLVDQAIALLQAPSVRVPISVQGKEVHAKTPGQEAYLEALRSYPVVFGIGPAGTGKTYLAMAEAAASLLSGHVRRIVLTRPAVEAGENLGFLPGSASEKIDPYLRPLFDALGDLVEEETLAKLMAAGAIEIAPLAYMRGRTLNDSYIILDEAQNTTAAQMKMFLTRLGFGSRMVVTGDDSQVDLGQTKVSGLQVVQDILGDIPQVNFTYLTSADVVRNPLVGQIVEAYSRWEASR
ncbi:PhoH family protein [Actinomycetaceae bacterium WB03_NA08]|uniref:PhoH-like protein n=1 Tax=Scrofimicrobium canadense TaxID=2652290 RepID=A0A6N7W6L1_9ACTO|nr:PhoH family protein [Scrofimicrobium canadense]